MSETNGSTSPNPDEKQAGVRNIPVTIHSQYVKDISFENPHAPEALSPNLPMPELEINIGMDARSISHPKIENLYEVALSASVTAQRKSETVFIAEVVYCSTVSIGDEVPPEQHHPILLIEVPRLSFPFVRQILSTLTQQGGYPPVLLSPVDFQALYIERFRERIQDPEGENVSGEAASEKKPEKKKKAGA
ncbi:MAG: protein-export chaperone SecB [Rhodospirillales bacterium]|nr:protein-export chaperone SecB [Alphaproteobacteria bacterium]MCB9977593.1 protein-export chaperone SecB [Rhodospirillales bacterium]